MRFPVLLAGALIVPTLADAQTTRSVLLPPNPIDRATAASDQRSADARRAADADRLNAEVAARDAGAQASAAPQSTMTDGVAGFGTRPIDAPPPSSAPQI